MRNFFILFLLLVYSHPVWSASQNVKLYCYVEAEVVQLAGNGQTIKALVKRSSYADQQQPNGAGNSDHNCQYNEDLVEFEKLSESRADIGFFFDIKNFSALVQKRCEGKILYQCKNIIIEILDKNK